VVAGIHIPTLLLTFFFRQMRPLIEAGYLYIAQPPLFKVKKGRSERYIKDEATLEDYLLDLALQSVSVTPSAATAPLEPDALHDLLQSASKTRKLLDRMSLRRLDDGVVNASVQLAAPQEAELADEALLQGRVAEAISERFEQINAVGGTLTWSTAPDPEHAGFRLIGETRRAGVIYQTTLDTDFLRSPDYGRLLELSAQMAAIGGPPYSLSRGEAGEPEELAGPVVLLERLLALGEKGLSIQRYKGLGEMNPDQLADTTMDASKRTLLQVRVDDAVEADEAFTTLMGDDVEPRREFIEKNALEVQNLDV
jgi:DNA gyrase subunit B